jgi:hypothetical protein
MVPNPPCPIGGPTTHLFLLTSVITSPKGTLSAMSAPLVVFFCLGLLSLLFSFFGGIASEKYDANDHVQQVNDKFARYSARKQSVMKV